jgi:hypothetical protein
LDPPSDADTRHGPSLCSSRLSFFTAAAKAVIFSRRKSWWKVVVAGVKGG